jgi:peptide/nickel transport system permease protein
MTEQAIEIPRGEPFALRLLKSVALLRESGVGMIGAGIIVFWALVAVFAGVLAPFEPNEQLKAATYVLPGTELPDGRVFWLGTDHLGRDILSRIIYGTRQVLLYAPLATFCAYAVGIPMGLAAGYVGGWVDEVLSFLANVILSFPVLVLYVLIIATVGASAVNIVVAVTFASAPGIMRIVRGLVLDLRSREYVAAAETRGESAPRIMFVEILPNARGPLIVDSCLRLGYVVITIGVLGFLGLGLPPPDPDWGGMVNETRRMQMMFPHMGVYPCIAISSLVLGFNLLADGLREVSLRD